MPVQGFWLLMPLVALAVGILAVRWARVWFHARGARAITCPENLRPAGVQVDARHAALTAWKGAPDLRLAECTRWPERQGCGQACLAEIQTSPDGCLVRHILADWYQGKECASCGRPFGEIRWTVQKPALFSVDKKAVEWSQVPVEKLRELLETAKPVCFSCHMASTLVREHPELVVDRGALGARRISS